MARTRNKLTAAGAALLFSGCIDNPHPIPSVADMQTYAASHSDIERVDQELLASALNVYALYEEHQLFSGDSLVDLRASTVVNTFKDNPDYNANDYDEHARFYQEKGQISVWTQFPGKDGKPPESFGQCFQRSEREDGSEYIEVKRGNILGICVFDDQLAPYESMLGIDINTGMVMYLHDDIRSYSGYGYETYSLQDQWSGGLKTKKSDRYNEGTATARAEQSLRELLTISRRISEEDARGKYLHEEFGL